jgi:hypothetical protein
MQPSVNASFNDLSDFSDASFLISGAIVDSYRDALKGGPSA